ncbi:hypothetical protein ASD12_20285 [Mesorhizobium sp. Root102]|uniref:hypothetical protein n=1 Tax=Mesorhizobium sp. Root102 TaxID=1736422 RepID=UPI0006F47EBC|nr:hypothetical protein [Mesorhizobium sp. Root102]KQU98733.1 hypothetical protein ASD12_20285 [Mesorhizobium sp. Root102]
MADEANKPAQSVPPKQADRQSREQSTIQFPYGDLNDAAAVANALIAAGGHPADIDQLAGFMKQQPNSGNFRLKIATARMFGVIETVANKYTLTDLGFAIVDEARKKPALADAFLNVPLYRRVYDDYRNKQLPPRPLALERAFVGYGVAPKQADRARHAFDRNGRIAGYFEHGNDRLIRPVVGSFNATPPSEGDAPEPLTADQHPLALKRKNGDGGDGYHPFIQGLLKELPEPGTEFRMQMRVKWLRLAASAFDMIYEGGEGEIHIGEA